ncbi:hypothetical protein IE53DRAFT_321378 [Violaceomyces palustris]|uniref:Uncharacterized protein n=1 Tax=Violaceomyces palustris TaxID=1673888 RepID=A0ACD0NNK2_9BASI|nr:hypothetical protein IE53DRAFT_321378 [Violaceomyces palustris]
MASKREAKAEQEIEEYDEDERALDPKLAEHPDAEESEISRPAKRRKAADGGASWGGGVKGETNGASTSDAGGENGSPSISFKRSDFNPRPGHCIGEGEPTPLMDLQRALFNQGSQKKGSENDGGNVVFWMRMHDLRIHDSRALALASDLAAKRRKASAGSGGNLIVLHILSPGDFKAHDRGPRRIDFLLRALKQLEAGFNKLDIPLVTLLVHPRTTIPDRVLELCKEWGATELCANIEYEVDELWRDLRVIKKAREQGVHVSMLHDSCIVPPGKVLTGNGKPYSVFSPWNRKWTEVLSSDLSLIEASPDPEPNPKSIRTDAKLKGLFERKGDGYGVPDEIAGFECHDKEYMAKLWPVTDDAPFKVLDSFMTGKGGQTVLDSSAIEQGKGKVEANSKESRLGRYAIGRNLVSENGTSRISPYLAAGLVSARECIRRTKAITKRLTVGRDSGAAMWNTEIAFRDFYAHVLAAWPKVSMGHAFIPKYENVRWERDEKSLEAWKEGKTGYPIVDAAQRQCLKQGYMHNRGRMISAMFLTKHLLQDWRLGEKHFSIHFVDQDQASNNGGWQWSASTGTDPQPYFRIFNPLSQSEKSDPEGDYIRYWVPELKGVKGKAIHDPFNRLTKAEFKKLGYPEPIVEHKSARERALRRYKNPGDE